MFKLNLVPGKLTLQDLRRVKNEQTFVTLDKSAEDKIAAANKTILDIVEKDQTVYGVNTGFGLLANTKIAKEDLEDLQERIVLSHSAGIGEYISNASVRLMILLKINSLSLGFSGIRLKVIQALIDLINKEVYPCVPKKGSVGASGDLAPLAHMAAILLGYGYVKYNNEILPAKEGLEKAGMSTVVLGAKEGLALLNGTQLSTAFALEGLFYAEDLFASAVVAGSMTTEAVLGSRSPFDKRVHEIRGHQTQIDAASMYVDLLEKESEISLTHVNCDRVQDPYSIRCQPQVMGLV